eukprot:1159483-Pelagomonas_calceolata.AAC.26
MQWPSCPGHTYSKQAVNSEADLGFINIHLRLAPRTWSCHMVPPAAQDTSDQVEYPHSGGGGGGTCRRWANYSSAQIRMKSMCLKERCPAHLPRWVRPMQKCVQITGSQLSKE